MQMQMQMQRFEAQDASLRNALGNWGGSCV
jgi:hypothetical protein